MTLIYRLILVLLSVLVLRSMFRETSFWKQFAAAMILIPMALRILMIK